MINWKSIREASIIPIFLSFLVGIVSFFDTTFRLFFYYALDSAYPLSIYLKPVFFICQIIFFIYFINAVKFSHLAESLDRGTRRLLDFQLLLIIVAVIVYFVSVLGNFIGFGLTVQGYIDLAWLLLFWMGPGLTSFWIAEKMVHRRKIWIATVFLALGIAFLVKPFESLYLWTQTYLDLALPYGVVAFGMFGPFLLMVSASVICSVFLCLKFRGRNGWRSIIRNPFVFAAGIAVLMPVFLQGVKDGLPNMIIRTLGYWGLGYVGFDWYAVSMYLLSLVLYIFVIRQLSSKLNNSLSSSLLKFGALSLAWNGVAILLFGYSSIAGNLLSLDALLMGLIIRWNFLKTRGSQRQKQE